MNRFITNAINYGIGTQQQTLAPVYKDAAANRDRRRAFGRHEYVHGMGNMLRDTWVATWDVTDRTLRVAVPNNYPGWANADGYTRARVVIADRLRSMPGIMPLHNYGGGR